MTPMPLTLCSRLLLFTLSPSFADSASADDFLKSLPLSPAPGSPWDVTGAASLGMAKGNADNLTYSLQLLGTYAKNTNEGHLGADLFYSEDNGTATTNSFRLFGQYNHLFNGRLFIGSFGTFLTDEIADLDYRLDAGVTLGYYFLKNGTTKLSFEAGPGYTWEKQGGLSEHYLSLRFAQRLEHKLSKRSKIWQSLILTPEASHFDNRLLVAEAGFDILLTKEWALRNSIRYQFDHTPASGQGEDDLILLTGLSYALGGFPAADDSGRMTLKPTRSDPEPIQMGWSTTSGLTVSLAQGNSDSLFLGLSAESSYRQKTHETFLAANSSYSANDGDTSADALRASAQHNRFLDEKFFFGTAVGYFRDDVADVSYRITPTTMLGYYLIKNDEVTLSIEAGPSVTFEEVGDVSDDFFSLTTAQKFTWELSDRFTLNQNFGIILDPSESDNAILTANAYLD
ncbi:MAG: putative salt-induced outer membrane protein YdiY, partial [Akkermansiaceae bacterium]